MSHEPRSLPLLLLNSGDRIFKSRFTRNTACERITEILNRRELGIGVYAPIRIYAAEGRVLWIWKAFDNLRIIVAAAGGKYVRGPDGEPWIDEPPGAEASIVAFKPQLCVTYRRFVRKGPQP
jgi:hypothetical protein